MQRWWAFGPYAIVGVVHLVGLFTGADAISGPSKGMLMPALLFALLIGLASRRGEVALWAGLGILLAWVGDLLLSTPGETVFVAGLGTFMLTHVAYLVLFLRPLRVRRIPLTALILVPWWAALLVLLAPHLGVLLVPVAVYGLVLGASTAAALGTNRIVAVGGLIFLLSDTLLAFKLFWPDFSLWQVDFLIMIGYITGQALIAFGAVRQRRRATAAVTELQLLAPSSRTR